MKNHYARKRFGQHFLIDPFIIDQIVTAIHPLPEEHLVEIGPGQGALTDPVLKKSRHLEIIEIDRDLVTILKEKYRHHAVNIHEADALTFDFSGLPSHSLRLFGNLPYNISTPLLFHLLSYSSFIQDMTFMFQKEIVDRLAAEAYQPEYGRLTVMIQYACQVIKLFDISPEAFSPPPKVTSSMVKLIPYSSKRPHPLAIEYDHFANLVNKAFQHRRKTLKNALGKQFPAQAFHFATVDPQQRPETVTVEQYVKLSNFIIDHET